MSFQETCAGERELLEEALYAALNWADDNGVYTPESVAVERAYSRRAEWRSRDVKKARSRLARFRARHGVECPYA